MKNQSPKISGFMQWRGLGREEAQGHVPLPPPPIKTLSDIT